MVRYIYELDNNWLGLPTVQVTVIPDEEATIIVHNLHEQDSSDGHLRHGECLCIVRVCVRARACVIIWEWLFPKDVIALLPRLSIGITN